MPSDIQQIITIILNSINNTRKDFATIMEDSEKLRNSLNSNERKIIKAKEDAMKLTDKVEKKNKMIEIQKMELSGRKKRLALKIAETEKAKINEKLNDEIAASKLAYKADAAIKKSAKEKEEQNNKLIATEEAARMKKQAFIRSEKTLQEVQKRTGVETFVTRNNLKKGGMEVDKYGKIVYKGTTKQVQFNEMLRRTNAYIRPFRMELLSTMFAGMALANTMGSITQPALQAFGVFDLMNATLIDFMAPATEEVMKGITWLTESMSKQSPEMKKNIGLGIYMTQGLGALAGIAGEAGLAYDGFTTSLAKFRTTGAGGVPGELPVSFALPTSEAVTTQANGIIKGITALSAILLGFGFVYKTAEAISGGNIEAAIANSFKAGAMVASLTGNLYAAGALLAIGTGIEIVNGAVKGDWTAVKNAIGSAMVTAGLAIPIPGPLGWAIRLGLIVGGIAIQFTDLPKSEIKESVSEYVEKAGFKWQEEAQKQSRWQPPAPETIKPPVNSTYVPENFTYTPFVTDFIMRPGQGPISFDKNDTIVGTKTGEGTGGTTLIVNNTFNGITNTDDIIRKVNESTRYTLNSTLRR